MGEQENVQKNKVQLETFERRVHDKDKLIQTYTDKIQTLEEANENDR